MTGRVECVVCIYLGRGWPDAAEGDGGGGGSEGRQGAARPSVSGSQRRVVRSALFARGGGGGERARAVQAGTPKALPLFPSAPSSRR